MARPIDLDDPDDPRLADFAGLTDAEIRRRVEVDGGFFLGEGPQVVARLVESPHPIRSVAITTRRWERMRPLLEPHPAPVYRVPQAVLDRVAGFHLHRGVVASATRLPPPDPHDAMVGARAVAVLEGINDQENLGAIFRSALALGLGAVLLDSTCADPYYRRTVRVSMGAVAVLPFTRLSPWPAALDLARSDGFAVIALTPRPDAVPIDRFDLPRDRRPAILLGAEGPGLSEAALQAADAVVRIPMIELADSLNVGHAAAIAFHRLVRR
ncbi:MAG: RNA methyltransferase [Acidimicrobiia bacterium]